MYHLAKLQVLLVRSAHRSPVGQKRKVPCESDPTVDISCGESVWPIDRYILFFFFLSLLVSKEESCTGAPVKFGNR